MLLLLYLWQCIAHMHSQDNNSHYSLHIQPQPGQTVELFEGVRRIAINALLFAFLSRVAEEMKAVFLFEK